MPNATKAELKKLNKKNAKGVTHNLKDTAGGNRVVHEIKTKGCHVVVGGVVENIQICPEGNETLPKTQRKYFYPKTGNWVSYMRARRLNLEQNVNLFTLPENEIKKVEKEEPEVK